MTGGSMTAGRVAHPEGLASSRWATTAVFFANGCGIGAWAASIPSIKAALQLSDGELSLVLLAIAAGAVLTMPLTSLLVPRAGGSGVLTRYAGIAFAIALALPGISATLPVLAASALLLGASNGLLDVSTNAYASGIETRWGKPIMSSFHASFSLGGLLGASLAGFAIHLGATVAWLLPSTAALLLLTILALARWLQSDRSENEASHGLRWPGKEVLDYCVIALFCLMIEGAMADWSAVYLTDMLRTSPALAAAGYASFSTAMLLGRLTGDRTVQLLGRSPVLGAGALLAGAGLLLAVLASSPPPVLIGFAMVGLGLANVVPVVFSLSAQRATSPAVGVSMAATTGYLGFLAGPPLIGMLASHYDLKLAMTVLAACCGLMVLLSLRQQMAVKAVSVESS
jgi:MFS family permease